MGNMFLATNHLQFINTRNCCFQEFMYQCVESLAYVCKFAACQPIASCDPACSQGKNWKLYAFCLELSV
jgi:hypothetical protein